MGTPSESSCKIEEDIMQLLTCNPQYFKSESNLCYDLWSVSQSILVSSTHLGLQTKFFFLCLTVAGLLIWGTVFDERMVLSFTVHNVQYIYILHVMT
jgi:hypothetical protein